MTLRKTTVVTETAQQGISLKPNLLHPAGTPKIDSFIFKGSLLTGEQASKSPGFPA